MTDENEKGKPLRMGAGPGPLGTGACTKCNCKGFLADPDDSNKCIATGNYPNKCQHLKSEHK